MKKIEVSMFVRPEMQRYMDKVLDENRAQFAEIGFDFSEQDVLEIIFEQAILKECEKYGYKG